MALGGNYMTHFNLMRTKLVKKLGGWDPKTDGAQDWDLFLRLIKESSKPVIHVPKIVYHWRMVSTSTANGNGAKPYVVSAQKTTVKKYLKSINIEYAEPKHDINGQMNIHWYKNVKPTYIVHALYHDVGNVINLIKDIGVENQSRIVVFFLKGRLTEKESELLKRYPKIKLTEYNPAEFTRKLLSYKFSENIIYAVDSIKSVKVLTEDTNWSAQLCGWLQLPGVKIAGGGAYSESGQITDIGSFFDSGSRKFSKYYFGAGLRSGYNGHSQWIRNHILVCEKIFAFDSRALGLLDDKLVSGIRDDEFPKAIALAVYSNNCRSVYDPLVYAIDYAPFELRFENSRIINEFINNECSQLIESDPYYNVNLTSSYGDPKPLNNNYMSSDSRYISSIDNIS
jgi:hypothetical protein